MPLARLAFAGSAVKLCQGLPQKRELHSPEPWRGFVRSVRWRQHRHWSAFNFARGCIPGGEVVPDHHQRHFISFDIHSIHSAPAPLQL